MTSAPKVMVTGQIHIHFSHGGAMSVALGSSAPLDLLSLTTDEYELVTDVLDLIGTHIKSQRRKNSPED